MHCTDLARDSLFCFVSFIIQEMDSNEVVSEDDLVLKEVVPNAVSEDDLVLKEVVPNAPVGEAISAEVSETPVADPLMTSEVVNVSPATSAEHLETPVANPPATLEVVNVSSVVFEPLIHCETVLSPAPFESLSFVLVSFRLIYHSGIESDGRFGSPGSGRGFEGR